jgi:glycosyltransferase involved in cell wall biosynthesis
MGFPSEKISVVPHFYETKELPPPFSAQGSVLFLSRLSTEKGGQELLRAWAQIQPGQRELWIAGTGPEEPLLRKQAESCKNVKFLGFLDAEAQRKAWANCSFAVIPSIVPETFGMIVLEAWARQRPVVAYRIGALAETVADGVDGILVNPGDSPGLAQAMERFSSNPEEARRMGLAGYEKLKRQYTRDLWLQRIGGVYQSVLSH